MKLLDIILEDPRSDKNTAEVLIQKLRDSPNTTGLTFGDNVEVERRGKEIYVKNYSCKTHPEWFKDNWASFYDIRKGSSGCPHCAKEKRIKNYTPEELTQELINSPFTKNLNLDNIEYEGLGGVIKNIKIKNYSCKIHPTWFKDVPTRFDSVKDGYSNCAICSYEKKAKINSERKKSDDELVNELKTNLLTSGLTFNDVQFKRETKETKGNGRNMTRIYMKDFSCKKHKWWKRTDWTRYENVLNGYTGCKICATLSEDIKRGRMEDNWDGKFDDDVNSPYNKWIKKRNQLLQNNWLKISKKEHTIPETGKPKYGYDKVNFNDPDTIKYTYNPTTKKYRRERQFEIFCSESGHGYFIQSGHNHKKGQGCPLCNERKGEKYLANLFTNNDVKYVREKNAIFAGLKCDFYLTDKKVIIEYDGKQHFMPVFGSTEKSRMDSYITTYNNDNIRDNFAKTNKEDISIIRIPYTMTDEEINVQLFAALRKIGPNEVVKLPIGGYPSRVKPKPVLAKNQVDLNKPIRKPRRMTESTLSFKNTIYESVLLEYKEKIINQLIDKFGDVDSDEVKNYIDLFHRYSPSLEPEKRDITKYSWEELKDVVDDRMSNSKMKVGKIGDNDPKQLDKHSLIYNKDGVVIFKANSKEKCVRYGNGYNLCISSRGKDNKYDEYRMITENYYFVFNKNLDMNDPEHLIIIQRLIHTPPPLTSPYVLWSANNKLMFPEDKLPSFDIIEGIFPWLEGLKDLFV